MFYYRCNVVALYMIFLRSFYDLNMPKTSSWNIRGQVEENIKSPPPVHSPDEPEAGS